MYANSPLSMEFARDYWTPGRAYPAPRVRALGAGGEPDGGRRAARNAGLGILLGVGAVIALVVIASARNAGGR